MVVMLEGQDSLNTELRYNKIYLSIIERYKDYIEQKENISVAELPTMITPKDPLVAKKAEEIKSGFAFYSYDLKFADAAAKTFNFVKDEIEGIVLPLQFWLTPGETISFAAGDEVDKNLLLCSLLLALGNATAKVLMIIRDESERRVFVHCEFLDKIYLFDIRDGIEQFDTLEEMIRYVDIGEDTTAYEFNDHAYYDIA
jgi:hypothetical protein